MRKILKGAAVVLLGTALLSSCQNKTETGALTGAAVGVGVGALVGHGEGAVIGGLIGAGAGALIGHSMDEQDKKAVEAKSPQTVEKIEAGQPLSLWDIKALTDAGLKSDVIINQIKSTNSVYRLSTQEIIQLKNWGVSEEVINYMISTGQK